MNYRLIFFSLLLSHLIFSPLQAKQISSATEMTIESGFSPDGSAEKLILNTINSAQKSIRIAAYAFTSPTIVDALLRAKKRGIDIAVIVDHKQNTQLDTKGRGKAALNLLVNAKIPVKTLNTRNTQHSKYMVIDNLHIQTGSYNYSAAAALYNHENVIVIRNNELLAKTYQNNWQALYNLGTAYKSTY